MTVIKDVKKEKPIKKRKKKVRGKGHANATTKIKTIKSSPGNQGSVVIKQTFNEKRDKKMAGNMKPAVKKEEGNKKRNIKMVDTGNIEKKKMGQPQSGKNFKNNNVKKNGAKKTSKSKKRKSRNRPIEFATKLVELTGRLKKEDQRRKADLDSRTLYVRFPSTFLIYNISEILQEIKKDSTDIRIGRIFQDRPIKYCFVEFATKEVAEKKKKYISNLKHEGEAFFADNIGTKSKKGKTEPVMINPTKLFIESLPKGTTRNHIRDAFTTGIRIDLTNNHREIRNRFAHVSFNTRKEAEAAFTASKDLKINGMKVTVLFTREINRIPKETTEDLFTREINRIPKETTEDEPPKKKLKVKCATEGCKSSFMGVGHSFCRQHSACKEVKDDGSVLWNPDLCAICSDLARLAFDTRRASKEEKRGAFLKLCRWARGFQKNRRGSPFLSSEKWRLALFKKANPDVVYGMQATSTFHSIVETSTSQELQDLPTVALSSMDLATENIADVSSPSRAEVDELLGDTTNPIGVSLAQEVYRGDNSSVEGESSTPTFGTTDVPDKLDSQVENGSAVTPKTGKSAEKQDDDKEDDNDEVNEEEEEDDDDDDDNDDVEEEIEGMEEEEDE